MAGKLILRAGCGALMAAVCLLFLETCGLGGKAGAVRITVASSNERELALLITHWIQACGVVPVDP